MSSFEDSFRNCESVGYLPSNSCSIATRGGMVRQQSSKLYNTFLPLPAADDALTIEDLLSLRTTQRTQALRVNAGAGSGVDKTTVRHRSSEDERELECMRMFTEAEFAELSCDSIFSDNASDISAIQPTSRRRLLADQSEVFLETCSVETQQFLPPQTHRKSISPPSTKQFFTVSQRPQLSSPPSILPLDQRNHQSQRVETFGTSVSQKSMKEHLHAESECDFSLQLPDLSSILASSPSPQNIDLLLQLSLLNTRISSIEAIKRHHPRQVKKAKRDSSECFEADLSALKLQLTQQAALASRIGKLNSSRQLCQRGTREEAGRTLVFLDEQLARLHHQITVEKDSLGSVIAIYVSPIHRSPPDNHHEQILERQAMGRAELSQHLVDRAELVAQMEELEEFERNLELHHPRDLPLIKEILLLRESISEQVNVLGVFERSQAKMLQQIPLQDDIQQESRDLIEQDLLRILKEIGVNETSISTITEEIFGSTFTTTLVLADERLACDEKQQSKSFDHSKDSSYRPAAISSRCENQKHISSMDIDTLRFTSISDHSTQDTSRDPSAVAVAAQSTDIIHQVLQFCNFKHLSNPSPAQTLSLAKLFETYLSRNDHCNYRLLIFPPLSVKPSANPNGSLREAQLRSLWDEREPLIQQLQANLNSKQLLLKNKESALAYLTQQQAEGAIADQMAADMEQLSCSHKKASIEEIYHFKVCQYLAILEANQSRLFQQFTACHSALLRVNNSIQSNISYVDSTLTRDMEELTSAVPQQRSLLSLLNQQVEEINHAISQLQTTQYLPDQQDVLQEQLLSLQITQSIKQCLSQMKSQLTPLESMNYNELEQELTECQLQRASIESNLIEVQLALSEPKKKESMRVSRRLSKGNTVVKNDSRLEISHNRVSGKQQPNPMRRTTCENTHPNIHQQQSSQNSLENSMTFRRFLSSNQQSDKVFGGDDYYNQPPPPQCGSFLQSRSSLHNSNCLTTRSKSNDGLTSINPRTARKGALSVLLQHTQSTQTRLFEFKLHVEAIPVKEATFLRSLQDLLEGTRVLKKFSSFSEQAQRGGSNGFALRIMSLHRSLSKIEVRDPLQPSTVESFILVESIVKAEPKHKKTGSGRDEEGGGGGEEGDELSFSIQIDKPQKFFFTALDAETFSKWTQVIPQLIKLKRVLPRLKNHIELAQSFI